MQKHGFKDVTYLPNLDDFLQTLEQEENKAIIITFGAGSITNFSFKIAEYLKDRGL